MNHSDRPAHERPIIIAILAILVAYGVATAVGWTERATEQHARHEAVLPQFWAVIPFTILLAAIAVLPLLGRTAHWWESNINKFYVAVNLALITLVYLTFFHPAGSLTLAAATLEHSILNEYIPFIVLLFSLYTITGGIRIAGDLRAHSLTNATFMAVGGILASLIGTTGAAMLLVRPLLETNSQRKYVAHTVVMFIFVVCNCGGLLLPIGDPPLFLGYLNGVPFLWTLSLWRSWLLVNGLLVLVYFLWDHLYFYPHEASRDIALDERRTRRLEFSGVWPNVPLLCGVILAVALLDPANPFPGTTWHPWLYLREAVQLALVALSLEFGPHRVRAANNFNYMAILEVAVLFVGIFICMQPALEILNIRGADLGLDSPQKFFWASGSLSAVLDNAPTYLVFFKTAQSLPGETSAGQIAGVPVQILTAISLGSVLMGSMTYIGNGPNFMVKAIAEKSGIAMPSFFGYLIYSLGILLPILILNAWLFL